MLVLALLLMMVIFFFNDTAPPEIYTLSLHDALPISSAPGVTENRGLNHRVASSENNNGAGAAPGTRSLGPDRKSTRLNSSHVAISYAVFCLKKKKQPKPTTTITK